MKSEFKNLKLVLMSCCAPCSAGAIAQLRDIVEKNSSACSFTEREKESEFESCPAISKILEFIVLFYNPNIYPESEFQKRLAEQIKYCEKLGVKYAVCGADDYADEHARWLECVAHGRESEPERGSRCTECFKYRFAFGARWARENGYNAIASVFGVSRHKSQSQVDAAMNDADKDSAIVYLASSILRFNESLRQEINQESNFYRQNYCGCEFSIKN